MNHPLTDEIMERIAINAHWSGDTGDVVFRWDDMRAAANWQLEQCIAWLDDTDCDDPQETAQRLREAMRPQKEQLQQEGNS
jgi:hypothetical protein